MDSAIPTSTADPGRILPAETHSADETRRVGRAFAHTLRSGDIIALYGNLGAGKTVFVRGVCEGLGLDPSSVTSPTFTILHEYRGGRLPIYHFDAYRVEGIDELFGLGYEEYFFGDGISVIEWADRIESLLPDDAMRIHIEHGGGDERRLEVSEFDSAPGRQAPPP